MKADFLKNQKSGLLESPLAGQPTKGVLAFATYYIALGLRRMFGFEKMLSEIQFRYKIKKVQSSSWV